MRRRCVGLSARGPCLGSAHRFVQTRTHTLRQTHFEPQFVCVCVCVCVCLSVCLSVCPFVTPSGHLDFAVLPLFVCLSAWTSFYCQQNILFPVPQTLSWFLPSPSSHSPLADAPLLGRHRLPPRRVLRHDVARPPGVSPPAPRRLHAPRRRPSRQPLRRRDTVGVVLTVKETTCGY